MAASSLVLLLRCPSFPGTLGCPRLLPLFPQESSSSTIFHLANRRRGTTASRYRSGKCEVIFRRSFLLHHNARSSTFRCFYKSGRNPESNSTSDEDITSDLTILKRWDVPWQWQTVSLAMVASAIGFVLTGLAEASLLRCLGFNVEEASLDEKAESLFAGQLSLTVVTLGVIFGITNTFRPLSEDIFRYDIKDPFNLRNGWLLWAGVGLLCALVAIAFTGLVWNFLNGTNPERETDALVRLLPLIGSSNVSTFYLVGITGVLAPVLEETLFRGFLMVSLTKWFPTPVSVFIAAVIFSVAHLTPSEFPQLFILGTVLGFSYSHTRNLLTPITIHSLWNSGVILLLTILQLQGYDIKELLQASP